MRLRPIFLGVALLIGGAAVASAVAASQWPGLVLIPAQRLFGVAAAEADASASDAAETPGVQFAQAIPSPTPQPAQLSPPAAGPEATPSLQPSQVAPSASQPPAATAPSAARLNDADLVLVLIRSTMIAVAQANLSGNYTVLRDTASPRFRDANTAADLARIFAPIRDGKIDLGIAAIADPHLTTATLNEQKMLYLVGSFDTKPVPVRYELLFEPVKNVWQLFGISVVPVSAIPPPAAASAAPQAQAPAKPKPRAAPRPKPPAIAEPKQ